MLRSPRSPARAGKQGPRSYPLLNSVGYPNATLLVDGDGNLYGTTHGAGAWGGGTLFRMKDTGRESVLWNFKQGRGIYPSYSGLTLDHQALNFYGTTIAGGNMGKHCSQYLYGCGVVFKVHNRGETALYKFTGGADGAIPNAGVVIDQAGNLYGTAAALGPDCTPGPDCGTLFKLDPAGTLTILHTFGIQQGDGTNPEGGLLIDQAGDLYGTTAYGGIYGYGTVFRLTRASLQHTKASTLAK
jgi:uncharacterized repeat protein (TIGR03803 family)